MIELLLPLPLVTLLLLLLFTISVLVPQQEQPVNLARCTSIQQLTATWPAPLTARCCPCPPLSSSSSSYRSSSTGIHSTTGNLLQAPLRTLFTAASRWDNEGITLAKRDVTRLATSSSKIKKKEGRKWHSTLVVT